MESNIVLIKNTNTNEVLEVKLENLVPLLVTGDYIVIDYDYMKILEVFADLTTTVKESLLDEISANFIKNWDKKTVKSIISNKTDKTFNNRTKKNAYFYDDVEHKLFFNEDLADFTDTKKIIEALAYANFDYFLFYNMDKVFFHK